MYEGACGKVLIVDDTRLLRELVRDALLARFPGLEVIEAGNAAQGYQYARELRPGLALLDIGLPDGNGLELGRRIRDALPEVSVCIWTTEDCPEYRQAAADAGAVCFISKQDSFWGDIEQLVSTGFRFSNSDREVLDAGVTPGR
jgi:DNA-binding NarL/FixJ family response regulator